jgi:hypothetical protein
MAPTRLLALAGSIICLIHGAVAERASVQPNDRIPEWQEEASMTLRTSIADGFQDPTQYTVVPLTETLGLNGSETLRGVRRFLSDDGNAPRQSSNHTDELQAVSIQGTLVWIRPDNYQQEREDQSNEVAYVSCDDPADSDVTADDMVNAIMDKQPRAILLFSAQTTACALEGKNLTFGSIFTFVDSSDSLKFIDILNGTGTNGGTEKVTVFITGNATDSTDETVSHDRGDHSAVAMSVLYSITGLITMLFLLIIGAGAIRAHRYPERYGPRSSDDGSGGQSRAKGIARAVLDTIPIVKFGEPSSPKKTPSLELGDTTGRNVHDLEAGIPRATSTDPARSPSRAGSDGNATDAYLAGGKRGAGASAENLDCSICTDKFIVGEDVRVLPCDHKFHPCCIDPWLTEVSGTCPLWYVQRGKHRPASCIF